MAHKTYSLYTDGSGIISLHIAIRTYTLYTSGSEKVSLHISTMPNKMLLHSEHITYILLVQKLLVHRFQACLIQFIALQVYTLYTNGSEIVSLHISTMPNKTCGSGPLLFMAGYLSLQVNTEHESTHSLRCKLCIIIIRF